ncbi:MAG: methyltransferase domain-containing protein [Bacteroidia bacterium]|nr:methyltransferase domain-containing protein [Bacteroidia bacterium]MCX7764218.1 methyltransferase domain-containing protein [Bacteroidia bacterium]MDW8056894.1 methyltransferase domain-containing protein [Bacteroidia bacterium]
MRALLRLWLLTSLAWGWGFWAHRRINRLAVFCLPETLFAFYRPHIDYLTRQATKPDERRAAFPWEPPRHYIDLDRYPPGLPRSWKAAVELLSEDTLHLHGILPWHLEKAFWDLVEAFRLQNTPRILKLSAEIGHYLADAHVPLHTTANYNGQLTGQQGVHALWEALLPEYFGEGYDYWVNQAQLWQNPEDTLWKVIYESHSLVEKVLRAEREATLRVGEAHKYTYRLRGQQTIRTYSETFLITYHQLLEGMVESRLRHSIRRLASLWLTAWHLAGRPSLLPTPAPPDEELLPDTFYTDPRCGEGHAALQSHFPSFPQQELPFSIFYFCNIVPLPRMSEWFASPYYSLLYAHRDDKEAERFVKALLGFLHLPTPAYALDAGCGEGRYARALYKAGLIVDAVDAAVAHPNLPEGVRFFQQDLRIWEPDRRYHLIGSFFTSLGLGMQRWDEIKHLLKRMAGWLTGGGWLVVDYLNIYRRNPTPEEERVIQNHRFHIKRWQDSFLLYKSITVYPPDGASPQTYEERVFKLTEGDLYQMIERAGLEIKATWGDYDGTPFHPTESPRVILLAQKPVS